VKLAEFCIGQTFYTGAGAWVVTDVGSRTIVAVEAQLLRERPAGPPYEHVETVFAEYDFGGCTETLEEQDTSPPRSSGEPRDQAVVPGSWANIRATSASVRTWTPRPPTR
jgi:hypothetical protein